MIKYPRTPHLPWSPGATSDDRMLKDTAHFEGKSVVITEKMDGENTTLYRDGLHARSLDSKHHVSRSWLKEFHAGIKNDIPEGWRICGENLWAKHSIKYTELPSYFMAFSIWDEENVCLSWEETEVWAALFRVELVPVLYRGPWTIGADLGGKTFFDRAEGYVVRLADGFAFDYFDKAVAKYVRKGHVQTDEHWMHGVIEQNEMKK